jgi:hypothetical protein
VRCEAFCVSRGVGGLEDLYTQQKKISLVTVLENGARSVFGGEGMDGTGWV